MLKDLPPKLVSVLDYDNMVLDAPHASPSTVLQFRRGAQCVLLVRLSAKRDACAVEITAQQNDDGGSAARICREHFDRWFGGPADTHRLAELP